MDLPTLGQPSQPTPSRHIRAACVDLDNPGFDGDWPSYFSFPPRVGDLVKSLNGRVAKIANVIHIMGATGEPIVLLELARNTGGSTPVEGGNASLE